MSFSGSSRLEKPLPNINTDEVSTPRAIPKDLSRQGSRNAYDADVSRAERMADEIAEKLDGPAEMAVSAFEAINDFWEDNEEVLKSAAEKIASIEIDSKTLESTISAFSETSKVVITGLEALSEIHPFIGAAVIAFKLVITLNATRGENTRKVLALKVLMQNTMVALFQLRHMRDSDVRGPDNITIQDRLQGTIHILAKDIEETGSFCDHYLKKGFLAKTLKSPIYQSRLARYGNLFIEHRQNLEFELTKHSALGIDSANKKLDSHGDKLDSLEEKLDMLYLLKRLETPRERDIEKFVKEKGGPHVCIQNDQLLTELIEMSGEGIAAITSQRSGDPAKDMTSVKWALSRELSENLDAALAKNLVFFERKLEAQGKQMKLFFESSLRQEGEHIISTLMAGAYERITDLDMQSIWKDMGWKSSVKARHFVLALQDYFTQKFKIEAANSLNNSAYLSPASTTSLLSFLNSTSFSITTNVQRERWAVAHIHIAHVQPILEAIDDDGTGFISVNEVNTFAMSRPDGWSLPLWVCYWAAGWHAGIDKYRTKIYAVIQKMSNLYNGAGVLPANRRLILEYLCHYSFTRIELLLRSTRRPDPNVTEDHALQKLMDVYTNEEESRLEQNLEAFGYEIDAAATVSLVTGPGRIERFVYPLLYLLLKRQLKAMLLAEKHVLDEEEFITFNQTLMSVFAAVDDRIAVLTSIFRQTYTDVRDRLGHFAFGMLQLSADSPSPDIRNNSLAIIPYYDSDVDAVAEEPTSGDILKFGYHDSLDCTIYDFEDNFIVPGNVKEPKHPLQGYWAGHCWSEDLKGGYSARGLLQIYIKSVNEEGEVSGLAENYSETMSIIGRFSSDNSFKLVFTDDSDGFVMKLKGDFDLETQSLSGTHKLTGYDVNWEVDDGEALDPLADLEKLAKLSSPVLEQQPILDMGTLGSENVIMRTFLFTRTPASAWRYRARPEQTKQTAKERWRFACNSVLNQVRQRLFSWSYLKQRFTERKRFLELSIRQRIDWMNFTPRKPLSEDERTELRLLIQELHPADGRFYSSLVLPLLYSDYEHHPYICDSCGREIIGSRLMCLQRNCLEENYSLSVDLCTSCRDATPAAYYWKHEESHSILKLDYAALDSDMAWIIPEARAIADRVKGVFRVKESTSYTSDDGKADVGAVVVSDKLKSKQTNYLETICCCCRKEVFLPCWVCQYCSPDAYICDDCEASKQPALNDGPAPWHDHQAHHTIRVKDSQPVIEVPTTETRLIILEKRITELEAGLNARLGSLEHITETRQVLTRQEISGHVQSLEDHLERRFTAMEGLLQSILSRLPAQ